MPGFASRTGRLPRRLTALIVGAAVAVGWSSGVVSATAEGRHPSTTPAAAEIGRPADRAALSSTASRPGLVGAAGRPGSHTSGDTLFPEAGNGGYDVNHYAIKLSYSPRTRQIAGSTSITATATRPLSSFSLDLEGLQVHSVTVDGRPALFARSANKLIVTPVRPADGRFATRVVYRGEPVTHIDPDKTREGWIPTADGATVVGQPVGAMTWFPNNNTPRDKATFRMAITVPHTLSVASNGVLVRRHRSGSQTTWVWRQPKPMATYLAMISIGRYRVYHSSLRTSTGRHVPVWSFIDSSFGDLRQQRQLIDDITAFQERRYGPYPAAGAGIVVDRMGVGYALETQDRPVFDGVPDTATLVHELAHQWYGNSVTPRDWGDIWLNEGFARFAELQWSAGHGGPTTAAAFDAVYRANPPSSGLWSPAPAGLSDPADLFSDPVYVRGGLTLEALRREVGTAQMDLTLRRWAAEQKGRSVSTADFIALTERVTGRNLSALFHTWLYVAKRPSGY